MVVGQVLPLLLQQPINLWPSFVPVVTTLQQQTTGIMGWWPFGKDPLQAEKIPEQKTAKQGDATQDAALAPYLPKPVSVFEFGAPVQIGNAFLRGVCSGDNPDAVQACTWSVDTLQGKPREKKPVYRIEF